MVFIARRGTIGLFRWQVPVSVMVAASLVSIISIVPSHRPASAQGGIQWGAPYCGGQPRITSVADHSLPRYCGDQNFELIMYSGFNVNNCNGRSGTRCKDERWPTGPGYDGHSGYDFARDGSQTQGCGVGKVAGVADSLVFASESGTVSKSRWDGSDHSAGYGIREEIKHSGDITSLYGHLAVVMAEEGAAITRGQLIGAVGNTGNSKGAHLHFQAAYGDNGTSSKQSFDPYGWDVSYNGISGGSPPFPDPHEVADGIVALRLLFPGQAGPACPASCGQDVFVEDTDPTQVTYPLGAWNESPDGNNRVNNVGAHWTNMSGNSTTTRSAEYRCVTCPPGPYLVLAAVPWNRDETTTHVARFEVGSSVSIMDQHREFNRIHPIGVYRFNGIPMVRLTNRGDRYDFTAPATMRVGADSVIFRRLCSGVPPGTPTIPSSWGGGG